MLENLSDIINWKLAVAVCQKSSHSPHLVQKEPLKPRLDKHPIGIQWKIFTALQNERSSNKDIFNNYLKFLRAFHVESK